MWIRPACVFVLVASLPGGCATTADLYLKNGGVITGRITTSDDKDIFVRREVDDEAFSAVDQQPARVPREQVVGISHPGSGAMVMGTMGAVLGAALLGARSGTCGLTTADMSCQLTHAPLYLGVPLFFWGLVVHASSSRAANPRDRNWAARHHSE